MRKWRVPVTFSTDLTGRITSWSEGARVALGYEPQAFLGRPLSILFTEEDVSLGVPQRLLQTALDDASASLAGWRVDSAGRRVFMLGEVATQFGLDMDPVGFTVVLLPSITGPGVIPPLEVRRRQPGRELPDPVELAELFSRSDERFYILNNELDFLFVNQQAADAWGVPRAQLVGGNFIGTFPQLLDTEFLAAHLKAATEGVTVRLETLSPFSGRKVEISIFPNRTEGVSVLMRDPFDRFANVTGHPGDERLAEAYAALEIAVIDWAPATGAWNESDTVPDIFGLEVTGGLGGRERQLELLHPGDRRDYLELVEAALRAGLGWRCEYRIVRPTDGEVAWLEEVSKPVAESSSPVDEHARYVVTVWDVTTTKLAEERARSGQRRLQRELAANRRLEDVLAQATSADEPQTGLGQVVAAACELFAALRGAVRLPVEHEAKLRIVAQHGHDAAYLDANSAVAVDAAEFDALFSLDEAGKMAISPPPLTGFGHDRMEGRAYRERWVPLVGLRGRVVGLLSLEWHRPYRFSDRDELDLSVLARLGAVLCENHMLEQRSHDVMQRLEQRSQAQGVELLQSEIRFRRAFEAGPVASCIMTIDEDRFVEVNDGYVKLTGYLSAEVVGRTSRELGMWSSREDQAKLEAAFQAGAGFRELELRLRTKDGRVRDILLSGEQIVYQGQPSWLKMFHDVTDQHRSQEELMSAIRQVMADSGWIGQSVVQKLAEIRYEGIDEGEFDLTTRELQVLGLVAAGLDDDDIADELGISRKTVRNHLTNAYAKTGVHSRSEAVIWARDRGIVARPTPSS